MAANSGYYHGWTYGGTMDQYGSVAGSAYSTQSSTGYSSYPASQQHSSSAPYSQSQPSSYSHHTASQPVYETQVQYGPYGSLLTSSATSKPGYGTDAYSAKSHVSTPAASSATNYSSQPRSSFQSVGEKSSSSSQWQPAPSSASKSSSSRWMPTSGATSSYGASAATSSSSASFTGLDAAVYSAAKNFLMEKQGGGGGGNTSWKERFRSGKGPPIDPSQWKYCELCKCTCAGELAYRAHLVGKAHKKKEAQAEGGPAAIGGGNAGQKGHLYCQLCEVSCSSSDAYAAHIRGAKHQKILKLQLKMGKPVPDSAKEVVPPSTPSPVAAKSKKIIKTTVAGATRVISTPKITFVGGTQLKTTGGKVEEIPVAGSDGQLPAHKILTYEGTTVIEETVEEDTEEGVVPIGLEYILESLNETGTAPNFYCKLCECSFTDRHAKYMHSKGRRHRLQYKKKVDPSLKVESGIHDIQKAKYRAAAGEFWRRREIADTYKLEAEELRYEKELLEWQLLKSTGQYADPSAFSASSFSMYSMVTPQSCGGTVNSVRDNQHIMAKHAAVYPTEEDLKTVQVVVSNCEKGLKLVSDYLAEQKKDRTLKGVMRVGLLAKGLLLHDLLDLELVILTSEKPTRTLLNEIAENLPKQIETFTQDKYTVTLSPDGSRIQMSGEANPNIVCNMFLTSPTMVSSTSEGGSETKEDDKAEEGAPVEEEAPVEEGKKEVEMDPDDILDRESCLQSLAALRHAKWFQAKANSVPSCVIIIRIMMDFCKRVPTWTTLGQWALEQLVERVLSSEGKASPAVALRRVFECVASGILMPGGPGLYDPCEKEPTDTTAHMGIQEREDITNSAQHALRMLAFGQVHKVLGIERLAPPPLMSAVPKKRARNE